MAKKQIKKQSVKSSTKNKTLKKAKPTKPAKVAAKATAKPVNSKPAKKAEENGAAQKKLLAKATAEKAKAEKLKKDTTKKPEPEVLKKAAPAVKPAKAAGKKTKAGKGQKSKDEPEIEDDFLSDDVEGMEDIGEYEEELKAVEEADDETEDETAWDLENKDNTEDEIILTDAEGNRYCRARDCDQISAVDGYCRYHYLLFWKKIQIRKKILIDGKLERYVEELTSRFPDKFLEMIRRDLRTTKDFMSAIQELEIDESASADNDFEEESQSFIDEVRGISDSPGVDEEEF